MMFELLTISVSAIYVVKYSGIIDAIKRKWFTAKFENGMIKIKQIPPFDCESCLTFWASLAYLFITQPPTIMHIPLALTNSLLTIFIIFVLNRIQND